jgi:hypothetical protein
MKPVRLLLILMCLVVLSFNSHAQIGKGQIMLGGSASISVRENESTGQSEQKTTRYSISPEAGLGIGKNWIIGASLGYSHLKDEVTTTSSGKATANTYSGGLFARKFHPFNDKFGLYAQVNAEYGFGKGKNTYSSTFADPVKYDITTLAANMQPGLYFNPGKKIILEATFGVLGYSSTKYDFKTNFNDTESKGFDVSISDGLSLGFKVIL